MADRFGPFDPIVAGYENSMSMEMQVRQLQMKYANFINEKQEKAIDQALRHESNSISKAGIVLQSVKAGQFKTANAMIEKDPLLKEAFPVPFSERPQVISLGNIGKLQWDEEIQDYKQLGPMFLKGKGGKPVRVFYKDGEMSVEEITGAAELFPPEHRGMFNTAYAAAKSRAEAAGTPIDDWEAFIQAGSQINDWKKSLKATPPGKLPGAGKTWAPNRKVEWVQYISQSLNISESEALQMLMDENVAKSIDKATAALGENLYYQPKQRNERLQWITGAIEQSPFRVKNRPAVKNAPKPGVQAPVPPPSGTGGGKTMTGQQVDYYLKAAAAQLKLPEHDRAVIELAEKWAKGHGFTW